MKKAVLFVALFADLALPAAAASTNTTTVGEVLNQAWDTAVGQGVTNLSLSFVETYTPSLKKWGSGLVLTRNLPLGDSKLSAGIGLGMDYYDRNFYGLNCQVSLRADIKPLSGWGGFFTNFVASPFVFSGAGPTIGGGTTGSGGFEEVLATGAALHIAHVPYIAADFSILGLYGDRQGLGKASGTFYGGGGNFSWKF